MTQVAQSLRSDHNPASPISVRRIGAFLAANPYSPDYARRFNFRVDFQRWQKVSFPFGRGWAVSV